MKTCLIIGDPVSHSLSPAVHNAGYRALGIDKEFHYEARKVAADELAEFMDTVRPSDIRGISCTAPHKQAIMRYLDEVDPVADKIGAINTIVNDNGRLIGYNTDWLGVIEPLKRLATIKDKHVALLGAGGAARSIAYGLSEQGVKLTIYNRTPDKATALAAQFKAASAPLIGNETAIRDSDIIVNATSVGMGSGDASPLPRAALSERQIVFDSVYVPYETKLLREAAAAGAQIIHGTEMLVHQALAQFKLYTGYAAPEAAMRKALNQALKEHGENI